LVKEFFNEIYEIKIKEKKFVTNNIKVAIHKDLKINL